MKRRLQIAASLPLMEIGDSIVAVGGIFLALASIVIGTPPGTAMHSWWWRHIQMSLGQVRRNLRMALKDGGW